MHTVRIVVWLVPVALLLAACTPPSTSNPDFALTLGSTELVAVPGGSAATGVTLTPLDGFQGSVTLTIADRDGAPVDGIAVAPGSIAVAGGALGAQSVQRTISVEVGAGVAEGSYPLRLTATSGGLASDADLDLTVAATIAPAVVVDAPADGSVVTGKRRVELSGTLASLDPIVAVDVLGGADLVRVAFDQSAFTATVELEDNANRITVSAVDAEGRIGVSAPLTLTYPFLDLDDFQPAEVVIGQGDLFSDDVFFPSADRTSSSVGNPAALPGGPLFLPDTNHHRVLIFTTLPTESGAAADLVLGQPDFTSNAPGVSATALNQPTSVFTDGTRLLVADSFNNRVLIWNSLPTANQTPPDLVVGQPDFDSDTLACDADSLYFPRGVAVADGRLIVADAGNNRVLIWNEVPTQNGEPADLVLGQGSLTNCIFNDDDQDTTEDANPSARTLFDPTGVFPLDGGLAVADRLNHRVLIWRELPDSSFTPADLVVGQADFVSRAGAPPGAADARNLTTPVQIATNGNQLFVVEQVNSRVVVYDRIPTANGTAADRVLGQSNFENNTALDDDQDGAVDDDPSPRTLAFPRGLALVDDLLIVNDSDAFRFVAYRNR